MYKVRPVSILVRVLLATLVAMASVVASAGSLPCLLGQKMPECPMAKAMDNKPKADHSCCHPAPIKAKKACCCLESGKNQTADNSGAKFVGLRFETLASLESVTPSLTEPAQPVFLQIAIQRAHGPPGVVLGSESPRAPPVA